jgi:hypothetical protein
VSTNNEKGQKFPSSPCLVLDLSSHHHTSQPLFVIHIKRIQ